MRGKPATQWAAPASGPHRASRCRRSARRRSEPCSERRPALEIFGTPGRSGSSGARVPHSRDPSAHTDPDGTSSLLQSRRWATSAPASASRLASTEAGVRSPRRVQSRGDLCVRQPLRRVQHDPRALHILKRQLLRPRPTLQHHALLLTELNLVTGRTRHRYITSPRPGRLLQTSYDRYFRTRLLVPSTVRLDRA